jgi:hypothetical protein
VQQQSYAVHLQRNAGKLAGKLNRGEFQEQVGEIFKQNSLSKRIGNTAAGTSGLAAP